jgi:polyisoprenoid-binding protein YceI
MKIEIVKRFVLPAAMLLVAAGLRAEPLKVEIDAVHSSVEFKVRHLVAKSTGKFKEFSGTILVDPAKPAEGSVAFTIKTASVDTGNAKRDEHLRSADFFDAAKFPEIAFKSTRITAKGGDLYEVSGILNMHGVANPIVLPVRLSGPSPHPWIPGGQAAGFSISTKLNRKDYGISWNKALDAGGSVLGDEVEITIELEAGYAPEKPAEKK